MKKINIKIILINIFLIISIFLLCDYIFFTTYKTYQNYGPNYIQNLTKKIGTFNQDNEYMKFYEQNKREPVNTDKNGKSIIFSGCSFAYGYGLDYTETIHYQLAKYINRPIYNLSFPGWGINQTIFLQETNRFYKLVKQNPALFIYLWCDFHALRQIIPYSFFESTEICYDIKTVRSGEKQLVKRTPPFIISRFSLLCGIRYIFIEYLLKHNKSYRTKIEKEVILHFKTLKNNLTEHYGNINFIIFNYEEGANAPILEEIKEDLEKEGFIIISLKDDIGIDVRSNPQYISKDLHPTKEVWELAAPILAKKIKPYI